MTKYYSIPNTRLLIKGISKQQGLIDYKVKTDEIIQKSSPTITQANINETKLKNKAIHWTPALDITDQIIDWKDIIIEARLFENWLQEVAICIFPNKGYQTKEFKELITIFTPDICTIEITPPKQEGFPTITRQDNLNRLSNQVTVSSMSNMQWPIPITRIKIKENEIPKTWIYTIKITFSNITTDKTNNKVIRKYPIHLCLFWNKTNGDSILRFEKN